MLIGSDEAVPSKKVPEVLYSVEDEIQELIDLDGWSLGRNGTPSYC